MAVLRSLITDNSVAASALSAAGTLTGSEIAVVTQGGTDVRTTLTAIAAFVASVVSATAATTPVTVPGSSTVGTAITGLTTSLTPSGATAYASLTIGGTEQTPRVSFTGTAVPSLTPATSGTATIKIWAASTGGTALATSASFTISAALTAPNTPTSFAKASATSTTIVLTWAESGGAPSTRTLTYRLTGSGSYAAVPGTTGLGSTGATVTGLTAGTAYDFKLDESNTAGSAATATLTNVSTSASGPANTYQLNFYSTPATTQSVTSAYAGYNYGSIADYVRLTPTAGGADLPNSSSGVLFGIGTSSTTPPSAATLPPGISGSGNYANGYVTPAAAGVAPYFVAGGPPVAAQTTGHASVVYYLWASADSGATWSVYRNGSDVPIGITVSFP